MIELFTAMKMKYPIFFLIAFAIHTVSFAQSDITAQISDALKRGDGSAIASLMTSPVDMTIEDTDMSVPQSDAKATLIKWFASHSPKSFKILHQGTSKLDDQYRIGELETSAGIFRITFFTRKYGNQILIKQLKIEAQ
jgi:hypothetical protein